ncbi:MAG: hypothetical protein AABW89_04390 [Nanoarchaeota archaeon]
MKKKVIVIAIVLAIFAFMVITHFTEKGFNQGRDTENNVQQDFPSSEIQQPSNQKSNENCQVQFTEYLVDPKYIQKVGQVGVVHGGGKSIIERSYISIREDYTEQEIPIYAPADMKLISGAHYKVPGSPENTLADYVLKFDAGCGVEVLLGHLKGVVDSVSSKLTPLKASSAEDEIRPPIQFKAGEQIGSYFKENKEGAVGGFDFVVRDRKVVNQFVNQERYSNDRARNLINGVCPYDYFTEEKKQIYYNLLGSPGGIIFEVKDCGSVSRDKEGTISGMWFSNKEIQGTIYEDYKEGDYGSPLSIMGDEEAATVGNIGTSSALHRIYSDNPTYKLPTEVTTEHCYQIKSNLGNQGYVYLKLIDTETMDVYYSATGSCPSEIPTNAKRYYK